MVLAATSGAACALLLAVAVWALWRPPSALTHDLSVDQGWAAASATFDARVRRRFPPGTPLWQFASELEAEGFAPSWYEVGGDYGAVRREDDFPCVIVARVTWRPDGARRVASARGSYRREGCI